MAPDPGAIRTVGCNLAKHLPDANVLADIQTAVHRAQSATVQACMLLNVHIRRCLDADLPLCRRPEGNLLHVTGSSLSACGSSVAPANSIHETDRYRPCIALPLF